jgi:hypothetical protein
LKRAEPLTRGLAYVIVDYRSFKLDQTASSTNIILAMPACADFSTNMNDDSDEVWAGKR